MGLLYQLEQTCIRLRHSAVLKRCSPLWDALRPCYNALMKRASQSAGLMRNFNGTDNVRIQAEFRNLHETYEPEVWHGVMNHVRAGSRVIDVGAHMGLYAMAFGHRVGPDGQVLAVEPDPANLVSLERHVVLNGLQGVVTVLAAGLSDAEGEASLATNDMQSCVSSSSGDGVAIRLTTLDAAAAGERWDLMLIDVEGFEEKVLRGGRQLLSDPSRRPTMIMIEVHPYAWAEIGTTSDSMLQALRENGYSVRHLDGSPVDAIEKYGHIVATSER